MIKTTKLKKTVIKRLKKGFPSQSDIAGFYAHRMTTINSNGVNINLLLSVSGRARSGGAMPYEGMDSHLVALQGAHDLGPLQGRQRPARSCLAHINSGYPLMRRFSSISIQFSQLVLLIFLPLLLSRCRMKIDKLTCWILVNIPLMSP